jgi:hypothetical protein
MQYIQLNGGNVSNDDRQLFISDVHVVATLTDRNNLNIQSGDVCKVTANNITYIYDGTTWIELSASNDIQAELKTIMTNSYDLIMRDNNNTIVRVPKGSVAQVLMSNTNSVSWVNLGIADITNLNSSLALKVNNLFVDKGDLIIGDGFNSYVKLPLGSNSTVLTSNGTNAVWSSLPSFDAYLKSILTTSGDLLYRNGANLVRLPADPGKYLTNVAGQLLWNNIPVVVNIDDLGDVEITDPQTGQVLRYNADIFQFENKNLLPDDITGFNTQVEIVIGTKYTAKSQIQCGSGNGSYTQIEPPTSDFRILQSDIFNILNPTGLKFDKINLDSLYFNNISSTSPTNGQVLSYSTSQQKYVPTNSLGFPLLAPNGSESAPSYSFVSSNGTIGMYGWNGGLGFTLNGAAFMYMENANNTIRVFRQFWLNNDLVGLSPWWSVTNIGDAIPQDTMKLRWQGGGDYSTGIIGSSNSANGAIGFTCNNTLVLKQTITSTQVLRLDVKNTQISESSIRINNATNTFAISNSTGSQTYLSVNTSGNNNLQIPLNRSGQVYYEFTGAVSSSTTTSAGAYVLFSAWPSMSSNNTGSLISVTNPSMTLLIAGKYHISAVCFVSINDANNIEIRLSKNGSLTSFWDGAYSIVNCLTNPTCVNMHTIINASANDTIQFCVKSNTGGKNVLFYAGSITVTNLFNI